MTLAHAGHYAEVVPLGVTVVILLVWLVIWLRDRRTPREPTEDG